jgi:hypothetical protein
MAVLAAPCTDTDTVLALAAVEDLPDGPQYFADIDGEIVRVLEVVGSDYRVERGTPAAAHVVGAAVVYVPANEPPGAAALRARLTAYLGNSSPTTAESVAAIKDLIRAVRYLAAP